MSVCEPTTYRLGEWDCTGVTDGEMPLPVRNFYHNADEAELRAALAIQGIAGESVPTPFNPLLLRRGDEVVLIDAGFGAWASTPTGRLAESLAAVGVAPDDVTVLLLTHGHADHAGGAVTESGALAFPNARVLLSRAEVEFWKSAEAEALAGRRAGPARRVAAALEDVSEDIRPGDEPVPGVQILAAPGHTPHSTAVRIVSEGLSLIYVADAVAQPLHLVRPDWNLEPDLNPEDAAHTRQMLIDAAVRDGSLMYCYHFALPGLGWVDRAETGYRWRPAC
ncbi:MAG TPA: MBL fold metallo-hydrolase [Armatimonadota bacterium]|jgi:glyoxylase-like metal-dependent hydrolase (beta-lactamase superfamily II)